MEKIIFSHEDKKLYHLSGFKLVDLFTNEEIKDLDKISNMQMSSIKPFAKKYLDVVHIAGKDLKECLDNLEKSIVKSSIIGKVWWNAEPLKITFSVKGVDSVFSITIKQKKNGNTVGIIETYNRPVLVSYILKKLFKWA